jgi:hypothetical protein
MNITIDDIKCLSLEEAQALLNNNLLEINDLSLENLKLRKKIERLESELLFSNVNNNSSISDLLTSNRSRQNTKGNDGVKKITELLKKNM